MEQRSSMHRSTTRRPGPTTRRPPAASVSRGSNEETTVFLFLLAGLLTAQTQPVVLDSCVGRGRRDGRGDGHRNVAFAERHRVVRAFERLIASNLRAPNRFLQFTLQILPNANPGMYSFIYTPADCAPKSGDRADGIHGARRNPGAATAEGRVVAVDRSRADHSRRSAAPVQISGAGIDQGAQLSISGVMAQVTSVSQNGDSMTAMLSHVIDERGTAQRDRHESGRDEQQQSAAAGAAQRPGRARSRIRSSSRSSLRTSRSVRAACR